jgi:hypothetical protein
MDHQKIIDMFATYHNAKPKSKKNLIHQKLKEKERVRTLLLWP